MNVNTIANDNIYAKGIRAPIFSDPGGTQKTSETGFGSIFQDALQNLEEQNAIKDADSYRLAVGDIDDLGAIATSSYRAQTALYLLVQMRNKLLDGYSEVMRMNL